MNRRVCSIARFSQRGRGFSLLELVLVLVILAVIGVIAARFLGGAIDAVFVTREVTNTQMEVGAAMDRMVRDVRAAQSVMSCSAGEMILALKGSGQRRYYVAGGRLWLEEAGDSARLAGNADDPVNALVCEEDRWGVVGLVELQAQTGSNYGAESYAYIRF